VKPLKLKITELTTEAEKTKIHLAEITSQLSVLETEVADIFKKPYNSLILTFQFETGHQVDRRARGPDG